MVISKLFLTASKVEKIFVFKKNPETWALSSNGYRIRAAKTNPTSCSLCPKPKERCKVCMHTQASRSAAFERRQTKNIAKKLIIKYWWAESTQHMTAWPLPTVLELIHSFALLDSFGDVLYWNFSSCQAEHMGKTKLSACTDEYFLASSLMAASSGPGLDPSRNHWEFSRENCVKSHGLSQLSPAWHIPWPGAQGVKNTVIPARKAWAEHPCFGLMFSEWFGLQYSGVWIFASFFQDRD